MSAAAAFELSRPALLWLLTALSLVIAPHVLHLPPWVSLGFFSLAAWRYLALLGVWRLPGGLLRGVLVLLVLVGVVFEHRTLFGRDAGVSLLVVLIGLKLLETNSLRDVLLSVFLGYFLVITNFLYSQSIPTALYMLAVMVVITGTLVSFSDVNGQLSARKRLRLAAGLLIQAFPLMLVLFLLFPRVEGPLWGLPRDAYAGVSGLGDNMSPGTISSLSLSDEVAFRVRFEGAPPPPGELYWRGPVLPWSDGRTWRAGFYPERELPELSFQGEPVDYTIILEAHSRPWLYTLEMPEPRLPLKRTYFTADYQLHSMLPVRERLRYSMRSYPVYRADHVPPSQAGYMTRLPAGMHPLARQLAEQWRQDNPDPESLVQRALRYFSEQPFVYTLEPPLLHKDPVDEFLFDTRRGFCEHYAAAFTTLMRAAGVPARVVTGYQGGEINPLGHYLVVRQRDAHAWSEVWLDGRGWVRVDPTAAVSPARIEQGMDTALPSVFRPLGFQVRQDSWLFKSWEQIGNTWDAVNNGWNEWVLGYGPEYQNDLLAWLGLGESGYRGMVVVLVVVLTALLLGVALWLFRHSVLSGRDPLQRLYLRFCAKLARRGLLCKPSEGPLDFAARAAARYPELAGQIRTIVHLYVEMRYHAPSQEGTKTLRGAVRRFQP